MSIRTNILLLFLMLSFNGVSQNATAGYLGPEHRLDQIVNNKIIAICKPEDFEKGHLEGAVRIWRDDYANGSLEYGGMMAERDSIAALLESLGITSKSHIYLYDHKGGCDAARFWWILRCYGHRDVIVLHGENYDWGGRNITTDTAAIEPTTYAFPESIDYSLFVDLKNLKLAKKRGAKLLDTRTQEEFTGELMKDGAFRAGHIPGALFCPWTEAINAKGNKKLKSKRELAKMYADLGLLKNDEIIVYCHSGVRSAHTTFVLTEILGYTNVKNYDGSWIEYSFNKNLPIETGGLEKPKTEPLPLSNSVWLYPLIIVLIAILIAARRKRKR